MSPSRTTTTADELRTYGEAYYAQLSPFGSYKTIAEAVAYTKRWYYGWLRYVDGHLLPLHGQGKRVLDVGCGMGALLALLQERGFACYGLDRSVHILSRVREVLDVDLVVCDIQDGIPFKLGFDLITCFETVEHLEEPDVALAQMYAALVPGGALCVSTPYPSSSAFRDPTHISLGRPGRWRQLLAEAGFADIVARPIWCPPIIWRRGRALSRALPAPARFSTTVLFVARKPAHRLPFLATK